MRGNRNIVVTREEIARAGGVRAGVEEAISLAALQMTPQAMTAYEAVGSKPMEEDGAGIVVCVEVENEEELREAMAAGAERVVLVGMSAEAAKRLREVAQGIREAEIEEKSSSLS
ncbi:MAG TPA: hypothetical protein VL128_08595 [Candidatus Eisenbacteria bacterium]|nr:hypothetical protein [Candidatus Eisenbacteria bacterium]